MKEREWWQEYFENDYLPFQQGRPYRDTREELDLLRKVLGPPRGRFLLDACCGQGRHAIPLADEGWRVVGVDQSPTLLEFAREEQRKKNPGSPCPRWVRADLRDPLALDFFDVAICLFTSFGYCSKDSDNERILKSIHSALKPGGRFVLDVANRDFLIQHPYAVRNWWRRDDDFILEETRLCPVSSVATTRNILVSSNGVRESEYRIRLYSLHELVRIMVETGFEIDDAYGNFPAEPIMATSPRLILIAKKGN